MTIISLALVLAFYVVSSSDDAQVGQCEKSAYRVAVDIGHHATSAGATSARGVTEYEFNLRLAKSLSELLDSDGFTDHFLIGETGASISLKERVRIANERDADVFISIHHDSVQPIYLSEWEYDGQMFRYSDRFHGFSIFISGENPRYEGGREFAVLVADALISKGFVPSLHHSEDIEGENRDLLDGARGIYRWDGLGVVRSTLMPAVLLEAGIIVNRDEEIMLSNSKKQHDIVSSIVSAIQSFCETTVIQ